MSNQREVWDTLSAINVNKHTDKKGQFTYLSWTWAWATLMEEYPDSIYKFQPVQYHAETAEVWVELTVEGVTKEMWLAVTDFKNNPVANPSSDLIANCRMRCLVKAIAMFGLGHYLYSGESLPLEVVEKPYSNEQHNAFKDTLEAADGFLMLSMSKVWGDKVFTNLAGSGAKGEKVKLRNKVNELIINGNEILADYIEQSTDFTQNNDEAGFRQLVSELHDFEKRCLFDCLPPEVISVIKGWAQ